MPTSLVRGTLVPHTQTEEGAGGDRTDRVADQVVSPAGVAMGVVSPGALTARRQGDAVLTATDVPTWTAGLGPVARIRKHRSRHRTHPLRLTVVARAIAVDDFRL